MPGPTTRTCVTFMVRTPSACGLPDVGLQTPASGSADPVIVKPFRRNVMWDAARSRHGSVVIVQVIFPTSSLSSVRNLVVVIVPEMLSAHAGPATTNASNNAAVGTVRDRLMATFLTQSSTPAPSSSSDDGSGTGCNGPVGYAKPDSAVNVAPGITTPLASSTCTCRMFAV